MRKKYLSLPLAIAAASVGTLAVPSMASACVAGVNITDKGLAVAFRGWAVDCRRTWTYSWRLRYYTDGHIIEWTKENFSGVTSFSSATHDFPNPSIPKDDCAKFFVYHSRTVGQNKVDEAQDCLGIIARKAGPLERQRPEGGPALAGPGPA